MAVNTIENIQTLWGSISIVLSAGITLYIFFKSKRSESCYLFLLMSCLAMLWMVFETMGITIKTSGMKWRIEQLKYFPTSFISECFLFFLASYFELSILKNKKLIFAMLALAGALYTALLTNPFHHLFYTDFQLERITFGPLFYVFCVKSYFWATFSLFLLIRGYINYKDKRREIILILLGVFIPASICFIGIFLNSMHVFYKTIDFTILSIPLACLLIGTAIFKHNFLRMMPDALKKAFESMKEAAVIMDTRNNIIDFNQSFIKLFESSANVKRNKSIVQFISLIDYLPQGNKDMSIADMIMIQSTNTYTQEIEVQLKEKRAFIMNISPIISRKGTYLGKIISLSDVTEYKNLLAEIHHKNCELTALNEELRCINEDLASANNQLAEHVQVVEELAYEKERNRITQEVHDTLGHTLTAMMMLVKVGIISIPNSPQEAETKLRKSLEIGDEGLYQLRQAVSRGFDSGYDIIEKLENIAFITSLTGLKIELSINGEDIYKKFPRNSFTLRVNEVLYKTCKEALTNSMRHGKASEVHIILRFSREKIKFFMVDNGIGCMKIKKGLGLKGMEDRIKAIHGKLLYGSLEEGGFRINIEIPVLGGGSDDKSSDC